MDIKKLGSTAALKNKRCKIKKNGKKISKIILKEAASKNDEMPIDRNELEYKFFANSSSNANVKKANVEDKENVTFLMMDVLNVELAEIESPITSTIFSKEIHNLDALRIFSLEDPDRNVIVKCMSFFWKSLGILRKMALRLTYGEHSHDWLNEDGNLNILETELQFRPSNIPFTSSRAPEVAHVDPFHHRGPGLSLINSSSELLSVLEFDCGSLEFEHHPLFSIEHVLAKKLINCYNQYFLRKNQNVLKKTEEQLKHLNNTLDKLKADLLESKDNLKHQYKDPLIQKYHKKISEIRALRLKEAKLEKEITSMILLLWRNIKLVRKKMKFINSPVVLQITRIDPNCEEHEKRWQEQFKLELTNTMRDLEFDYIQRRLDFKLKMKSYKEKVSSNATSEKPIKPKLLYDKEELHKKVTMILNELVPLEQKIEFELNLDNGIVSTNISDAMEIERRNNVEKTKLCLIIFLDNIVICKSNIIYLNNIFSVNFNKKIAVQTLSRNKNVKLQFLQNDTILHEEMFYLPNENENITNARFRECEFINKIVVEKQNYAVGSGLEISEILASKTVKRLDSVQYFDDYMFTKGKFKLKLGWSVTPETNNSTLNSNQFDYESIECKGFLVYNQTGTVNFDNIKSLIKIVAINKSEELDYNSKLSNFENILNDKKFLTDKSSETFTNIDMNDPRLLLLKARNEQKLNSLKNKRIPLNSQEISTELLAVLQDQMTEEKDDLESSLSKMGEVEPLDLQRYTSTKYLKGVYEYIAHNMKEIAIKRHQRDLITDFHIPNVKSLFSPSLLKPRKHLTDGRLDTHIIHSHNNSRHNLSVTLVRAFRLPERLNEDSSTASHSRLSIQSPDAFIITSLRPFVRVSCQDVSIQSDSAVGCNPTWNQTINLPIRCDLSSTLNINLYDELREEVNESELCGSEGFAPSTVHYRLSSRWLAGLQVPLTTVLSTTGVEGTFKMDSPPTIFGYKYMPDRDMEISSPTNTNMDNPSPMTKDNIYITLYINVNPLCSSNLLQPFPTTLESSYTDYIEIHLTKYANDFIRQFPDRKIQTTFIDTNGKCKCVTHFLQPLAPPDLDKFDTHILNTERRPSAMSKSSGSSQTKQDWKKPGDGSEKSSDMWTNERDSVSNMFEMKNLRGDDNSLESIMQMCTRYVSLIPVYDHVHAGSVALRGLELLQLMCGSPLDHTLLLTSYFLYLGLKCWILLGQGLPRGYSTFVLIRINRRTNQVSLTTDTNVPPKSMLLRGSFKEIPWRYVIYDATTGQRYDLKDAFSPLRKVYFVFNEDNVWANVQQSDCCDTMGFDFANSSDWQPAFDKNVSLCKLPACHDLLYREPGPVDSLRQRIEEKVKNKIQKWRSHRRTVWNRYCSSILREALQHWEAWTLNTSQPKPEPSHRLKQLTLSYNVFGFPLNFPYINMKTMLSAIKRTALCMNDNNRVEFGLGLEVFSYPNDVISVWLYMAAITRRS